MFEYRFINGILNYFKNTLVVKTLDKVLSKIGFIGSMERTHVDTFTENRIKTVKGEKIGSSNFGHLYTYIQELGGFFILNTRIISNTNIKTKNNVSLEFVFKNQPKFILQSDEINIKSDFSNVSNQYITVVSYNLDQTTLKQYNDRQFDKILFHFNQKTMPFVVSK